MTQVEKKVHDHAARCGLECSSEKIVGRLWFTFSHDGVPVRERICFASAALFWLNGYAHGFRIANGEAVRS